jgi:hypothetical protein
VYMQSRIERMKLLLQIAGQHREDRRLILGFLIQFCPHKKERMPKTRILGIKLMRLFLNHDPRFGGKTPTPFPSSQ